MRRPFDDEDDDDVREVPKKKRLLELAVSRTAPPPKPAGADDEEEDPLDAFMSTITTEVQRQVVAPKSTARRDDLEEEDNVESYINHMKKQGLEVGSRTAEPVMRGDDSDEEVYAAARAIDEREKFSAAVEEDASGKKRDIEPLAAVDHSKVDYIEFEKNLYEEHKDIAAMSEDDAFRIRRELDIRVSGFNVAKPCVSFAHFGLGNVLLSVISKQGFSEPTGIQKQAIPVALSGRDIIGIAKTGSGKTAAFLWPMITHMLDQPELEKTDGPIGLILAPTRELAQQIYAEAKKYAKPLGLKSAVVFGGASKGDQFKELRFGAIDILVATPGRLIDMIKMKATNLRRVSFLVLDEADRMFDFGFEPQIRSIANGIRPDRQTLLFSATFQKRVESLARDILTEPIRISVGVAGQANSDVTQIVAVLDDDTRKWGWLTARLPQFVQEGSVVVFISRKVGVDELAMNLQKHGFNCSALHGDMVQNERQKVIHDFKAQKVKVLVSTDVAGRGLDIKSVKVVVNYDVARDIDAHVHRCGRTGRAGEKGKAYTLITKAEDKFAGDL
ncbi:hypothetical protein HK101_004224, partial [Irineochytrium annulatum]